MFATLLNCLVFAVMKATAKISQLVCGSYNANHDLLSANGGSKVFSDSQSNKTVSRGVRVRKVSFEGCAIIIQLDIIG